ncbi:MAG: fumarylacetoacetate hydrolase family protein [Actinomycetota bacterium]|nr:fumarylacetoacetate hydrolase family protein [Actinomycetota bacterium]
MRFTRILHEGGPRFARIEDEVAYVLDGSPITGSPAVVVEVPLSDLGLLPPVIPGVFYAVGLNYNRHIAHALEHDYDRAQTPTRPEVGYRANNALIGSGEAIVKPAEATGRFEAEGELVAVIGRRLKKASRAEAQDAIFGWTIGNDVSAREWQHADRTFWRSKNADTFKPMGPWIETDVDPMTSTTTVRIDGETKAEFKTGDMLFDPYDYLVEASRHLTISPGDVLWMGADSTVQLTPGSTVEVEISGIGTLRNPVIEATKEGTHQ